VLHEGAVVFSGSLEALRNLVPDPLWLMQTSDDRSAHDIGRRRGLKIGASASDPGFEVTASVEQLDGYVIALGTAGIAVRGLERRARSLEAMFLQITTSTTPTEIAR
jgi:ABC-2 type transport system ATP-binding protein